ncbi:hypothetical protein N7468_004289 [Penicillium chermesinum]|uniref:Uncharacterized protein n=1 Tax=Penicillium chermesinum TaxID=63820 RepID=A0A9W9P8H5_9EURO|nr:uncharacterized protein N7468_004289 [Penicillium chermesinum]KAJ5239670.1 hypothetical protein N7468_004289 [Penicillium chermesinum]
MKMEQDRQEEESEVSEWVLFTKVKKQVFSRDFLNCDECFLDRRWTSYDSFSQLLLAKMPPSSPHETAARTFEREFWRRLEPMGLVRCIRSEGSAAQEAEDGSAKQPDCQFFPKRLPKGRSRSWPTLVVEVGYSESPSKLMSDTRFWLDKSNNDVQMVIIIKVRRDAPSIVLERWEPVGGKKKRLQVVTVSKRDNNRIDIQGQPLIIPFEKIFLRQPTIPKERDLSLDEEALAAIADDVWDTQDF